MTEPITGAVPLSRTDATGSAGSAKTRSGDDRPERAAAGSSGLALPDRGRAGAGARCARPFCSVTPDGGHLTTGAAPSLPESYSRAIDGIAISAFVGTCAAAAARRHVIVDTRTSRTTRLASVQAPAAQPRIEGRLVDADLFRGGRRARHLRHVLHRKSGNPSAAERKLVEVLSRTAALAIERQRSDEALKRSERRIPRHGRSLAGVREGCRRRRHAAAGECRRSAHLAKRSDEAEVRRPRRLRRGWCRRIAGAIASSTIACPRGECLDCASRSSRAVASGGTMSNRRAAPNRGRRVRAASP